LLSYFPEGTKFLTDNGYITIENIINKFKTKDGENIDATILLQNITTTNNNALYKIPSNTLKNQNNLYLSPMQPIEYKNGMWNYVKNLPFSQKQPSNQKIKAYTITVPNFYRDLLIADSNPVESTSDTTALVYDEILNSYIRPILYKNYV
jgi:hypothetical protein